MLSGKLGERIFAEGVTVRDDPLITRGQASRPFDGEGLPARPLNLVEDGILAHYLLDLQSARKLGIAPENVVSTVDKHGNTSAASIPLALSAAAGDGRIGEGDLVLLEAMGGGFTWGSVLVRW